MADFTKLQEPLAAQIADMATDELFVVDIDGNELWELYLDSFPAGTNDIFRVRTLHDCSADKNFVRNMGNVVSFRDGKLRTIWDVDTIEPYDVVTAVLAARVREGTVTGVFRTNQPTYGSKKSRALIDGVAHTFDHFHVKLPSKYVRSDAATVASKMNTAAQVFERGLEELELSAVDTVLELIADKALYRGEEHLKAVKEFRARKEEYRKINDPTTRAAFVWENLDSPAARFRNTVIGTLVQDLSEGKELERAVKSFEDKVAPHNYKRPKALITARMVKDASEKLEELGMSDAVHRRFARIEDVSVNDVLFVNGKVAPLMKDGIEGLLSGDVKKKTVNIDAATPISMEGFMDTVVPKSKSIELLVENRHVGNFASLTAPQSEDTGGLFQWDNDFAWAYDGDVADSVKERVKRAGGTVDGRLRVSLGWYNSDDLDVHAHEPDGNHIYYGQRRSRGERADVLDVDMNAGGNTNATDPVENLCWNTRLQDGVYKIDVNQYSKRNSSNVGFELEVEFEGHTWGFSYDKMVTGTVRSLNITVKNDKVVDVTASKVLTADSRTVEKWGVSTNTLVPVDTLMLSPNHWGENEVGNKHWFFILQGCKNPSEARGMYNEFLSPELTPHRKVFEVLGGKTKCPVAEEQLSGLGFSSTRKDKATVVADNRAYSIEF